MFRLKLALTLVAVLTFQSFASATTPDRPSLCALMMSAASSDEVQAFRFLHTTYVRLFPKQLMTVDEVEAFVRATPNREMLELILKNPEVHEQVSPQGKKIVDIVSSLNNSTAQEILNEMGIKKDSIDLAGLKLKDVLRGLIRAGLDKQERRLVLTTNLIDKDSPRGFWRGTRTGSDGPKTFIVNKSKLIDWAVENDDLVMLEYLASAKKATLDLTYGPTIYGYLSNHSGLFKGDIAPFLKTLPMLKIDWKAFYTFMDKNAPLFTARDKDGYMKFGLPSVAELIEEALKKIADKKSRVEIGSQYLLALLAKGFSPLPLGSDSNFRVFYGLEKLDIEILRVLIDTEYPSKADVLPEMKKNERFLEFLKEKAPDIFAKVTAAE